MSGAAAGTAMADIVIKAGGALMRDPEAFGIAATRLGQLRRDARVVLVPGGGPFADAVRDADRKLGLGNDVAHWMAVMAMDQYAHVLGARIARGVVVRNPARIGAAHAAGRVPVLAPYRWLRRADPVSHSWDATSDSIAAWIAIALGAAHLVLLKPAAAALRDVTDAQFDCVLASAKSAAPLVTICTARTLGTVTDSLCIPPADPGTQG
jgi:5-(aminomethyl)-3-furanmethanol phosphate kinase